MKKIFYVFLILTLTQIMIAGDNPKNVVDDESKLYSPKTLKIVLPFEQQHYIKEEVILFKLLNNVRKKMHLPSLMLNTSNLLETANSKLSEPRSILNKNINSMAEENTNEGVKVNYIDVPMQKHFMDHVLLDIHSSPAKYRNLINKNFNCSALKILYGKNNEYIGIIQVFANKEVKDENDNENYKVEKLEFKALLDYFNEVIHYDLPKEIATYKLNGFIGANPDRGFVANLSSGTLIVHYENVHTPFNYVQIGFSVLSSAYPVVFNKAYLFKEENFYPKYKELKDKFGKFKEIISFPKSEKVALNVQRCYWLIPESSSNTNNQKELIELRWFNKRGKENGVFFNSLTLDYGLNYINENIKLFSLKDTISDDEYIYILSEYLKCETDFQIVEFLQEIKYLKKLLDYQKKKKEGLIYVKQESK